MDAHRRGIDHGDHQPAIGGDDLSTTVVLNNPGGMCKPLNS